MNDQDGFFMVKSALANGDRNCPIFKAWKKLWFSGDETKKAWARQMFDKSESQWVLVQVIEDENRPEMVGQIKVMKLPKAIYVKLEALMGVDSRVVNPIIKCIYDVMSEMDHGELKFSGLGRMLQYPEYSDKEKLGELLSTFEQKEDILNLVSENSDEGLCVFIGSESSVAVHIRHLREKIEINPSEPRYIKVVWGRGYKMEAMR